MKPIKGSDIAGPPLEARASADIGGHDGEEQQAEAKKCEVDHERDFPIAVLPGENTCARCKGAIRNFWKARRGGRLRRSTSLPRQARPSLVRLFRPFLETWAEAMRSLVRMNLPRSSIHY